jgi:hypothetical protein
VWSRDGHELFFIAGLVAPDGSGILAAARLMAAQVMTSATLAVTGVRPVFPLTQYLATLGRPSYDVFPNGDFLLLATQTDSAAVLSTPLVVRTNWASSLGEHQRDRAP